MSFIKLEKRFGVADDKAAASMTLRVYKGSPKPICIVSLRKKFLDTAKFGKRVNFDVAVGKDNDAGKIRIAPDAGGVFVARAMKSGTLILDLGHLPELGMVEHRNHPALVDLVDGCAIVTVPTWRAEIDDAADYDDEQETAAAAAPSQPAPPRAAMPQPPAPPAPAARSAAKSVTFHGVTINLTPNGEAVSYRGRSVDVSPRGALLVEALARVMPSCVADDFLVRKLWEKPPNNPSAMLEMVVRGLDELKKVGLGVKTQRGVGRQLTEAK